MKALRDFDHLKGKRRCSKAGAVLLLCVVGASAWLLTTYERVQVQRDEVTQLEQRIEKRQRLLNVAKSGSVTRTSDRQAVKQHLAAQARSGDASPLLLAIERVWNPAIGLLSISASAKDGHEHAKISGVAASVGDLYAFAGRLQREQSGIKVDLQRNSIKDGSATEPVQFTMGIDI